MVLTSALMIAGAFLQAAALDVPYPPNAATGGTVVVALSGSGQAIRAQVLSGQEPFVSAVRQAVSGWSFPDSVEKRLVVVKFRQPGLLAVGSTGEDVAAPARGVGQVPYPRAVTEPAYPPNAQGEGSVALRLELAASGSVERITTIKGLGQLTESGIEAVRNWSFAPAHDAKGRAIPSEAYVVFVFRTPVLAPAPPR